MCLSPCLGNFGIICVARDEVQRRVQFDVLELEAKQWSKRFKLETHFVSAERAIIRLFVEVRDVQGCKRRDGLKVICHASEKDRKEASGGVFSRTSTLSTSSEGSRNRLNNFCNSF